MSAPRVLIGSRSIGGPGDPVFVVAEVSGNHNQSYDRALALLRAARDAGADAVKLQTYTADTLTIDSDSDIFQVPSGPWEGRTLHELYDEAHTPWEWQPRLLAAAREMGIELFSTPFDETAVAFLENMGVIAYKIASFEVVDLALIDRVARTGKPVLISTGMATLGEIEMAVETARRAGAGGIALLHCTSAYPAPPDEMDLATIPHLREAFGVPVGLSDHTVGTAVATAAVALGAKIIEKHVTLRRADGGPDSAFSAEPEELAELVRSVRTAERAIGHVRYGGSASERDSLMFRRSLFVVADVPAGHPLTADDVRSIRPGYGLAPRHLAEVLGRRAKRRIARGTPLTWELLA